MFNMKHETVRLTVEQNDEYFTRVYVLLTSFQVARWLSGKVPGLNSNGLEFESRNRPNI